MQRVSKSVCGLDIARLLIGLTRFNASRIDAMADALENIISQEENVPPAKPVLYNTVGAVDSTLWDGMLQNLVLYADSCFTLTHHSKK